ncbi:MAG TPA: riboflavin synthase [Firmicutes bacterium]|nr:riboflavin synthase [Bacillota bacterium]
MFTGLVEEMGAVVKKESGGSSSFSIKIRGEMIMADLAVGDSVAVNGVCLTVTFLENNIFTVDVMPETMRKTNLYLLKPGEKVNLERSLRAGGRFGGHIVSGHIDGIGRVLSRTREGNAIVFSFSAPREIMRQTVVKGSIAIDGISLTVAAVNEESFSVGVIPHTAAVTTLGLKKPGDLVNLEGDIIAKYVWKYMETRGGTGGLTLANLKENGYI